MTSDMDREFNLYWDGHHGDSVIPIAQKEAMRKVAYHAFCYAYRKFSAGGVQHEKEMTENSL